MSVYDACTIDLSKDGFSPQAAARACAIATYQAYGLKPGDSELKSKKGSVSKAAKKIATSYSAQPINIPGHDPNCVHISLSDESFDFKYSDDPEDDGKVDPFDPMYVEGRGYQSRMLREVFLIRKGEFNGIPFTDEDLQALVDNWERPIPFQIDHSTRYQDNIGVLHSIRKQGSRVYGLCEIIGFSHISDVQAGKLKEVSVGFYLKPRKLIEFSATKFPAVGGKDPAQIINPSLNPKKHSNPFFSQAQQQVTLSTTAPTSDPSQPPEHEIFRTNQESDETHGESIPAKGKEMDKLPEVGQLSATELFLKQQFESQIKSLSDKLEAEKESNKKLSEVVDKQGSVITLQRNQGMVFKFCQDGLTPTANKDKEMEFLGMLSDEALIKYQELKVANGPVVLLSRASNPSPENTVPGEENPADREATKARLSALKGKKSAENTSVKAEA